MNLPLENKLALVIGSSRGIGAGVALRLAVDGSAVLVHSAS
jgi:3-oxoacyl-[acyl-carrier protein] reductase